MADWKPPPFGTPVWMAIPATDVPRTADFYRTVFNMRFKDQPEGHSKDYLQMFDLSPGLSLSGGVIKAPDATGSLKPGRGGFCINWHVEDVDASAALIEKAGGKMLTEKEKEGKSGMYRYFEDCEGNVGAVYMMV